MTEQEIDELIEEWHTTCEATGIPFTMADALEFVAQVSDSIIPEEGQP